MPMQQFVNPLPQLNVRHFLQFDFPVDYHAPWPCLPNVNIEAPVTEILHGKLGTPPKEQGHPCIREWPFPEAEDPKFPYLHDQVLDYDRDISICHTGRLSGTFVKHIAYGPYYSVVKMFANPIAPNDNNTILISNDRTSLTPESPNCNVWYWHDPKDKTQLIYTAKTVVRPSAIKEIQKEGLFKLMVKWEFWSHLNHKRERMPISGFDEAVTFEVITKTENF